MLNKISYFLLMFFYSVWCLDIFSVVGLFNGAFLNQKHHLKNISLSYIALFCLLIFLGSILTEKRFKTFLTIFTLPLSVINFFIVWFCIYYGALIGVHDIATILATNIQETKEFILTVFDYKVIIALLISLIPFPFIYFMRVSKINSRVLLALVFIISSVIIAFTYDKLWVKREIAALKICDTFWKTKEDRAAFFALLEEANKKEIFFNDISNSLNNNDNQLFVLIISESQNRHHFSVYGYNKNTTPFLKSAADELYVFPDVSSAGIHTSYSIEKMITFSDNSSNVKGYESGDLIRFFKDAGFKTYWLSNQYFLGPWDVGYSAIAYRADVAVFLNKVNGFSLETKKYDDAIIPYFDKILDDKETKRKFVVIHFIGSHESFERRYPENFGSFGHDTDDTSKQKYIAIYDNSIEWTDSILKNIILKLKAQNDDSYCLFLSDHGTDVYDTYPDKTLPRSAENLAPSMYQVPFIIWLSEKYKANYPDVAERLLKAINRKYQTDRVTHTILDLSRLNHKFYKEEDSILSDNYREKPIKIYGRVVE